MTTHWMKASVVIAVSAGLLVVGCESGQQVASQQPEQMETEVQYGQEWTPQAAPGQQPPAVQQPHEERSKTASMSPHNMVKVCRAIPSGDKRTSVIGVEKVGPARVIVGQPFEYSVTVTNLTKADLADVALVDRVPNAFNVTGTEPQAQRVGGDSLRWVLGNLGAGQSRVMRVMGSASEAQSIVVCSDVTYSNPQVCMQMAVVKPELRLAKTAPKEVLICDPIRLDFVVSNPGTGDATDVVIRDPLPEGLTTMDGKRELTFDLASLPAGQSRNFSAQVKADRTGRYANTATATAFPDLQATAQASTMVRQPVLALTKSAPRMVYLNTRIKYTISVTNRGDAPARETIVTDSLPSGLAFLSASHDGRRQGNEVVWKLGTLDVNDTRQMTVSLRPNSLGTVRNTVRATAVCAQGSAEAMTEVRGIPAILLEMIDVKDPIELGGTEVYEITVTNQGSAADNNIRIKCVVPEGQEYVSADGPTKATVAGNRVTFAPLASLAPKAKAVFRVTVKAVGAGDVRFRVKMTSGMITAPVEETEATRIYRAE